MSSANKSNKSKSQRERGKKELDLCLFSLYINDKEVSINEF